MQDLTPGFQVPSLIVLWSLAAVRTVRTLGAPTSLEGLHLGALVGLAGGILVIATSPLAALRFEIRGEFAEPPLYWGVGVGNAFLAALVLTVLTGVAGAVYAAFRPAPLRYARSKLTAPAWLWPDTAPAPRSRSDYCESCGTRFVSAEAGFCRVCGARRPDQLIEDVPPG